MLRVGLTGGIGAGKSMVATGLAERGAVLVDADLLAREVVQPGTDGLAAVVAAFGSGVVTAANTLDRHALGRLVFADPDARAMLNGILHPRIEALTRERFAAAPGDAVILHDVPLLVENGMGANYHLVLVVDAPVRERLRRLVDDRGMLPQDAQARILAQSDDAARRAAADVWLDNSGTAGELLTTLDALWAGRLVPFEANVRHRIAAQPAVLPVDPDPSWPAQAARLAARVARAVRATGGTGFRVDHVGPTAIGRGPAKDVLDLQLVVADRAIADGVAGPLEDAGFVRLENHRTDGDSPDGRDGPDGPDDGERAHASTDPGRPVSLQVRPADRLSWLASLQVRDWLISHPDEPDASAGALTRAQAWADGAGWAPGEPLASG